MRFDLKRNTPLKKPVKKTKTPAKSKSKVKAKVKSGAKVKLKSKPKRVAAKVVKAAKKKAAKTAVKKTVKKVAKKIAAKAAKKTAKKVVKAVKRIVKKVAPKKAVKKISKKVISKVVKKAAAKKTVTSRKVASPLAIKTTWPAAVEALLAKLDEAKAEQIIAIDVRGKSTEADTMVVASGRSNRHVNAIADQAVETLGKQGVKNIRIEGVPQCDWVLVDAGDILLHVFRPEVRSFYNLEKLWSVNVPE